jgi:anti-anti-sigma factor
MSLKISTRQIGTIAVLDLEGPVRLGSAEGLFREHTRLLQSEGTLKFAINLARVTDIDSSGIGLFVRTFSHIKRAGGACVFFAASERVLSVFRMVRLEHVLEISDDEAGALARL